MTRSKDLRDPALPLYASRRCQLVLQGTVVSLARVPSALMMAPAPTQKTTFLDDPNVTKPVPVVSA
jgi:hypothetical protein